MVTLNSETHVYTHNATNTNYESVTRVLQKLEHPFPAQMMASRIAERNNKTTEAVLKEWDEIRDKANSYGTRIHYLIENYLKQTDALATDEEKLIVESFRNLKALKSENILSEQILYSDEYKIAGMSDIIEEFPEYLNIWDIKTNIRKGIEFIGWKKWFLPPMQHLSECNYNKYSLQLSLYAYLAEKMFNKKIGRLGILFLNRKKEFILYPLPYLKYEAYVILEAYKNGELS